MTVGGQVLTADARAGLRTWTGCLRPDLDLRLAVAYTVTIGDSGSDTGTIDGGATARTYRLVAGDAGKKFKVRVGFTDLDGTAEALTSAAYPASQSVEQNAAPTVTLVLADTEIQEVDDADTPNVEENKTTITANLSHPSSAQTTVTIAPIANVLAVSGTLTMPAGQTTSIAPATLTALDNSVPAANVMVTVSATAVNEAGVTGPADVTLIIVDDEAAPAGTLRLVDGAVEHEGRLEMYYDGQWGTICDDYWTAEDEDVACKQLGYPDGSEGKAQRLRAKLLGLDSEGAYRFRPPYFGPGSGPIHLDNMLCVGNETNLLMCPRQGNQPVGKHNCRHSEDVSVRCAANSPRISAVPELSGPGDDGRWGPGEALEVTVTFSESVRVDTSGGTPSIEVRLGSSTKRRAVYDRGDGSADLVFAYELQSDDGTHATAHVGGDSLELGGGRIRSTSSGRDAILDHRGASIAGEPATAPALTAECRNVPASHQGPGRSFTFEIHFSAEIRMSERTMQDDLLSMRAQVDEVRRVTEGSNMGWELTVSPVSYDDVVITLPATADCTAATAVCTSTGQKLETGISELVPGLPAASVADAVVHEGLDATLDFVVTLTRPAERDDAVRYRTVDGTARAGEDYEAKSGLLFFDEGVTVRAVSVPVFDDSIDEGSETMRLELSEYPHGGRHSIRIADGTAIGTIGTQGSAEQTQRTRIESVGEPTGPGEDGVYATGDRIEVRVTPSAPVIVDTSSGSPTLGVAFGGVRREAALQTETSGTSTTELVFSLTVSEEDAGAGAAKAIANGIRLAGATLQDENGEDVLLDYGTAPGVTEVQIGNEPSGDGRWSAGEAIEVVMTFAEPVVVDTREGTPSVTLTVPGVASWQAPYTSGSGTDALTFAYTLIESDSPVSSVLLDPSSLALEGGSIVSTGGLNAVLTHNGSGRALTPRTPQSVLSVADAQGAEGATLVFRVTLSPPSSESVSVSYATSDATATAGEDYTAASGTLTFKPGDAEKTIEVEVSEDERVEDAETVTLTLSEAQGASIDDAEATGTIAPSTGATPFTASFVNVPPEHDGTSAFTVELKFSEEPAPLSYKTVRDRMFTVSGGTLTTARRFEPPESRRYELTLAPSGDNAVRVAKDNLPECEASESVCSDDGRALTGTLSFNVPGPVGISAADAEVREGPDATLSFEVTLDRERHAQVQVDYATLDDTAVAGEDYVATSGTLSFTAGETEKTVTIDVLPDAHDEGAETMKLKLSNARGGRIEDGEAIGTINNSDPMPKAWMVRFGRTVGSQVVDALTQRLDGTGGSHVTVGGLSLTGGGTLEEDEPVRKLGLPDWTDRARLDDATRSMTTEELIKGSAFHLSTGERQPGEAAFTAWGRFATGGFETEEDSVTMDGDVTTGLLGADAEWNRLLAGIMVSQSSGDGSYRLSPDKGDDEGTVESSMTGVYPYARLDLNERVSAWGIVGVGSGELTLQQKNQDPMETDLGMRMGALGVKGKVLDGSNPSGIGINVKSDAMWVRTTSDRTEGMMGAEGDVSRLRLILEAERQFAMEGGGTFVPSGEVGVRVDGGDAETGTGLELGAGVRYARGPITIEGQVRALVAHEASGYQDWGASGTIRVNPSESGRGLTFSVAPVWGSAGSASERLWSVRNTGELEAGQAFEATGRIETQLGYGIGMPGTRGVVTPYAGLSLSEGSSRTVQAGTKWNLAPGAVLGLEATRQGGTNGTAGTNAITFRSELRW